MVEAALGAAPALFGFATGAAPYFLTRWFAARFAPKDRVATLSTSQLLLGALAFPLCYAALIAAVAWRFSDAATVVFALLLIPSGLFARAYARRMRTIIAHIGDRTASWFSLGSMGMLGLLLCPRWRRRRIRAD